MSLDRKLELEDRIQEGERCDALYVFPGLSLRFNKVSFLFWSGLSCSGELMDGAVGSPWSCWERERLGKHLLRPGIQGNSK